MRTQIEDEWIGWDGDTIVKLTDGSIFRQGEYHYAYHYAYCGVVHCSRLSSKN